MTKELLRECIDLFCGAGLAALGLSKAGFKHVLGVDSCPDALLSFACNFGCAVDASDLSKVPVDAIFRRRGIDPDWAGCVWSSSPCTEYSNAGDRPIDDSGRNLIFVAVDAAEALKCAWVVVENVKAVKDWPQWEDLKARMEGLGRRCFEFELDAEEFGLAARRKRMFAVFPPSEFAGAFMRPQSPKRFATLHDAIGPGFVDVDPDFVPLTPNESLFYSEIEPGRNWASGGKFAQVYAELKSGLGGKNPPKQFLWKCGWDQVAPCMMASGGFEAPSRMHAVHPANRRFSVGEMRKLMGIEDDWFVLAGDLQSRICQVGNGVAIPVAEALGRAVEMAAAQECESGMPLAA